MKDKEYYSTIEAAKLLGVSVRTVQLWVESGALEAWKTAGGHRRIVASSVDDYIKAHQATAGGSTKTGRKSLLIVEDNPTVSKFYEAAIKSWGLPLDVVISHDGFAGLVAIGQQKPDLLIADIYMPGMDGLQMIQSLYKSDLMSAEQIIVISGLSEESIAERGGIPEGVEFFKKPVDVAKLKSLVLDKLSLEAADASSQPQKITGEQA
ncbi:MAG: response regulator [Gammaproteobacteria bacterium]|nr:response regulator [Gammaproteobacteria bacterium]